MDSYKIVLKVLILFVCFSCVNSEEEHSRVKQEQVMDKFYTSSRDSDLFRIPLIKPIQVISAVGYDDSWDLRLPYRQIQGVGRSIPIHSLTIVDSVIIIDAGIVSLPVETTQAWFLIDMKSQRETVCRNSDEYQNDLIEKDVKSPMLYNVNEVYSQFKEKGTLPW